MSPCEGFAGSFPRKIAITARLLGKELHRKKLKWFDLRRADYRLGEKVCHRRTVRNNPSLFRGWINCID